MPEATGAATAPATGPSRVLVIEDDERVRRLIARALAVQDVRVDEAEDGERGLLRAASTPYDVILLDLQMPGLDGIVVLRRILSRHPDRAVVVMSCRSDPSTVGRCREEGARAFLAKPFSLAELRAGVAAACASPSD